jgi:S1-C subfamily serine protease
VTSGAAEPLPSPPDLARAPDRDQHLHDAYSRAVIDVVEKVGPAVIGVRAGRRSDARAPGGSGSGVLITPDGYALTNDHVVAASANGVHAALPDGRALGARIIGRDPATDLALLQVDGSALPFAHLEAERRGAPRRARGGDRQPARLRLDGDGGDRLGHGPRAAQRARAPDRERDPAHRAAEPGQLGRPAARQRAER